MLKKLMGILCLVLGLHFSAPGRFLLRGRQPQPQLERGKLGWRIGRERGIHPSHPNSEPRSERKSRGYQMSVYACQRLLQALGQVSDHPEAVAGIAGLGSETGTA